MATGQLEAGTIIPQPQSETDLQGWSARLAFQLTRLFNAISTNVNLLADGQVSLLKLTVQITAPVSPQDGWIAFADGTAWNPGSGKGLYEYRDAAWYKL